MLLPGTLTTAILLAVVMLMALGIRFIGWSMEKREAENGEDLLAIPPKRPWRIVFQGTEPAFMFLSRNHHSRSRKRSPVPGAGSHYRAIEKLMWPERRV
jgi:hypothetical protein